MHTQRIQTKIRGVSAVVLQQIQQQHTLQTFEKSRQKLKKYVKDNITSGEEAAILVETIINSQLNDTLQWRMACAAAAAASEAPLSPVAATLLGRFLISALGTDDAADDPRLCDDAADALRSLVGYLKDNSDIMTKLQDIVFKSSEQSNGVQAAAALRAINYLIADDTNADVGSAQQQDISIKSNISQNKNSIICQNENQNITHDTENITPIELHSEPQTGIQKQKKISLQILSDTTKQALLSKLSEVGGPRARQELLEASLRSNFQLLSQQESIGLLDAIERGLKDFEVATKENAEKCLKKYENQLARLWSVSDSLKKRLRALGLVGELEEEAEEVEEKEYIRPESVLQPQSPQSVQDQPQSPLSPVSLKPSLSPPSSMPNEPLRPLHESVKPYLPKFKLIGDTAVYHIPNEPPEVQEPEGAWYVGLDQGKTSVRSIDGQHLKYNIADDQAEQILQENTIQKIADSNTNQKNTDNLANNAQQSNIARQFTLSSTPQLRTKAPTSNTYTPICARHRGVIGSRNRTPVPPTGGLILYGPLCNEILSNIGPNPHVLSKAQQVDLLCYLSSQDPPYERLDYMGKDRLNDIVSFYVSEGYVDQMREYVEQMLKQGGIEQQQRDRIAVGLKKLHSRHPLYQWAQRTLAKLSVITAH